jgi:hypothetical protein
LKRSLIDEDLEREVNSCKEAGLLIEAGSKPTLELY